MGNMGVNEINSALAQFNIQHQPYNPNSALATIAQLQTERLLQDEGEFNFHIVVTTNPETGQDVEQWASQYFTKNFTVKTKHSENDPINSSQLPEGVAISSLTIHATHAEINKVRSWVQQNLGNNVPVGFGLLHKSIDEIFKKVVPAPSTKPLEQSVAELENILAPLKQTVPSLVKEIAKDEVSLSNIPWITCENTNDDEGIPENVLEKMLQDALTSLNLTPVDTSQILLSSAEKIGNIMKEIIKGISLLNEQGSEPSGN